MGYRLSKIYTRTGDDGTTGLGDGTRIDKDSLRIEALGTVDEVNCHIGLLNESLPGDDAIKSVLQRIQHQLFDLGGEFAIPGSQLIQQSHIDWLEQSLDDLNENLPPLKNFILPGGTPAAAQAHLARSVCRRAERTVVQLGRRDKLNDLSRQYLNRLSDLLFVIARCLARRGDNQEILWESGQ